VSLRRERRDYNGIIVTLSSQTPVIRFVFRTNLLRNSRRNIDKYKNLLCEKKHYIIN